MPAGRPKGAINKKSLALIADAEKRGLTPMEVMLDNMRMAYDSAKAAEAEIPILNPDLLSRDAMATFKVMMQAVKRVVGFREIAQSCARDAAPYIHPRLTAVEHSGEVKVAKVIRSPAIAPSPAAWADQHVPKHLNGRTEH